MKPKASCGLLNPPLRGIVQLANSATLRFRNWSFSNNFDTILSLSGPISGGQALPKGAEQALAFFEEQKEKMFDPPLVDIFKGRVT